MALTMEDSDQIFTEAFASRLYEKHKRGAYVRSAASIIVWLFFVVGLFAGTYDVRAFTGISACAVYLILMNPPTLWVIKRIKNRRYFEMFSVFINFLEIIGYTIVIYFAGGLRAVYFILMYASVITYVGVATPKRVTMIVGAFCSIAFTLVVFLEHMEVIPHQNTIWPYTYRLNDIIVICLSISVLNLVVAFMASFTGATLKKNRDLLKTQNKELATSRRALAEAAENLEQKNLQLEEAIRKAQDSERQKSEFLANMSHEIRTPMNGVIGMTTLLEDTELTAEQKEYTSVIRNSGELLLSIINDILDFSKIEAGKLELENRPFNLHDCIESALDLVSPQAAQKGLELVCLVDSRAPAVIEGDMTRIMQVLINLLSNAVKFTQKGEVSLKVEPCRGEKSRDDRFQGCRFEVRDTGIGMSETQMTSIFDSFRQADSTTTRRFGGTGLGLTISKRIVELMGGQLSVRSRIGKGSVFAFTIQTKIVDEPLPDFRCGPRSEFKNKRVLIVDDNATNRRILHLMMTDWGFVCQEAENPGDALRLIENGQVFDIAVLDMQMPDMDGLMLGQAIRKVTSSAEMPMIMLSSIGVRQADAREAGFSACLTKPAKPSQLFNEIIEIFLKRQVFREVEDHISDSLFDPEMGKRHPLKILLAEDNAINQKLALRLLERLGYRADVAGNGLEAVQSVERQPYDVVLMDIQMPEMDGLDAAKMIVSRLPQEDRPHIIAMTANVMSDDRNACMNAGMQDFISKPVHLPDLIAALERCHCRNREEKQDHSRNSLSGTGSNSQKTAMDTQLENESAAIENIRENVEVQTGDSVLDLSVLESLRDMLGGDEYMLEFIDSFFEDAPRLLDDMSRAVEKDDAAKLRLSAHSLKSNSAEFGAHVLSGLCFDLEKHGKNGNTEGLHLKTDLAYREYKKVKAALDDYRKQMKS